MTSRVWRIRVFVVPLALALGACDGRFDLPGRATDEWTRRYPLADGGQLQISNTNGIVEIEGVTGSTVDVRAERVTAQSTNGMVDLSLSALGAGEVDVRTTNGSVSLTLPPDAKANLDASVTNGQISVTGLKFEASDQLRRRLSARLNGRGTPVRLSTTNGAIRIGAP